MVRINTLPLVRGEAGSWEITVDLKASGAQSAELKFSRLDMQAPEKRLLTERELLDLMELLVAIATGVQQAMPEAWQAFLDSSILEPLRVQENRDK